MLPLLPRTPRLLNRLRRLILHLSAPALAATPAAAALLLSLLLALLRMIVDVVLDTAFTDVQTYDTELSPSPAPSSAVLFLCIFERMAGVCQ